MSAWGSISGYRLTGQSRRGTIGTWHVAIAPDGGRVGALRFALGLVPAGTDRLAEIVKVHRERALPGLLPIAELTVEHGQAWLVTTHPATPTLADLLAARGGRADAVDAKTVLSGTGATLLRLHEAGLTHGALDPEVVVVGPDGTPLLAEAGLAVALLGERADPRADVRAWANLARTLARAGSPTVAPGLVRCAETAEAHGLAAGLAALRDPGLPTAPYEEGLSTVHDEGVSTRDDLPTRPTRDDGPTRPTGDDIPTRPTGDEFPTGPADGGYTIPAEEPPPKEPPPKEPTATEPPPEEPPAFRFGPGVPGEPPGKAAEIWRQGRAPRTRPDRRRRPWAAPLAISLALSVIASIVLWWLLRAPDLAVSDVRVEGPGKPLGCDSTATLTGVVTTNGERGVIEYEWRHGDERKTGTYTADKGVKTARMRLQWRVEGPGEFTGEARFKVITPTSGGRALEDVGSFVYRC